MYPKHEAGSGGLPSRKLTTFLILTFALSTPFYYLVYKAGAAHAYSAWLMWTPGIAALLTQLVHEGSFGGLGWGIAGPKFFAAAYVIPVAYVTVVSGLVWLTGLGGFKPGGFLELLGGDPPFRLGSTAAQTIAGIGFVMTYGVLRTCWATLGEELGWRGLLFADYHEPCAPLWFGLALAGVGSGYCFWHKRGELMDVRTPRDRNCG